MLRQDEPSTSSSLSECAAPASAPATREETARRECKDSGQSQVMVLSKHGAMTVMMGTEQARLEMQGAEAPYKVTGEEQSLSPPAFPNRTVIL